MGKKIKHLDFAGFWKSDSSNKYYQQGISSAKDEFDEHFVISIVKSRLLKLRKKKNHIKLRQFPNKGNGFDV